MANLIIIPSRTHAQNSFYAHIYTYVRTQKKKKNDDTHILIAVCTS